MPGLVPGIHVFCLADPKMWMAATSPAITNLGLSRGRILRPAAFGFAWLFEN
jgi:hypothetical protein